MGIGTMVGSGWLFSAYYGARIAGSFSLVAWFLAALIIIILGLFLAEISTCYPKRGLMARLLIITHGREFAFVCTVTSWLGLTVVIASEALGTVQYMSSFSPVLAGKIFNLTSQELTREGLGLAALLVFLYGLINYWGIRLLAISSIIATGIKIIIPLITVFSIIASQFFPGNFSFKHSITAPFSMSNVIAAMLGAGMIYSFNGFQNIVSFGSETRNPERDIPVATILSIVLALGIYLLLQISFIGAIPKNLLYHGWRNLKFTSPFIDIAFFLNLNFLTILLYADAFFSPSGTGIIYTGSSCRILTGLSEEGELPSFFAKKGSYNFSRRSLIATICLACLFLCFFNSWVNLVSFLSIFYLISYMGIPLALGKLRHFGIKGTFRLPFAKVLAPLLFILLGIILLQSRYLLNVFFSILVVFLIQLLLTRKTSSLAQILKSTLPFLIYILLLAILADRQLWVFVAKSFADSVRIMLEIVFSTLFYIYGTYFHKSRLK